MRKMSSASVMKRAAMLAMLVIVCFALSACYMDPDRVVDNQNGLDVGDAQNFENVITPTPSATPVPTPKPTSSEVDWSNWDFGAETATNPPSSVVKPTGSVTMPTGVPGVITATTRPTTAVTTPKPTTKVSATATPTAAPSSLKVGSTGSDVKRLQQQLKTLGYYTGSVDGDFGAGTEAAVKAFQSRNGLSADGKAGKYTLDKLYSGDAKKAAAPTATPKKTSSSSSSSSSGSSSSNVSSAYTNGETDTYLQLGSSGKQVKILQNRLIVLGYLTGEADGEFGASTMAAVKAFQSRNSLESDGVAGPTTLTRLYSSSARKASSPAGHLGSLRPGAQGDAVRSLQRDLRTLGYYSGSVDGDYGDGTTAAVTAFQRAYGLNDDGIAGKATISKIESVLSGGGSSGSSSSKNSPDVYGLTASSNGYDSLHKGNGSSSDIRALQATLSSHGYYSGSADGSYGSGTESAVKAYQRAAGLRVTGVAGPSTQRLLYGGTKESGSYSKLEVGSSGSAVKRLQYALYELKYYDGPIDGAFENSTYNAVLLFQEVNGLYMDGIAGQDTQRKLFSSNAVPCNR